MSAAASTTQGVAIGAIEATISPVLRAHGVELVELTFQTDRTGWILRVTVEPPAPEGTVPPAVTLAALAQISRDISAALDVADPIEQHYQLEVSSPGLDRPLRDAREFRRFVGKVAKVHLARPASDGQAVLRGRLVGATDDAVTLEVDGTPITAKLADVSRARLVYELEAQPKRPRATPLSQSKKAKR